MIKNYDKLIATLKDLKIRYDAVEQSEKDLTEARSRNVTTDVKKMADGYVEANAQLRTWAIEQGLVIPTLEEQADEMGRYKTTLQDLTAEYAKYIALSADIAKMPADLEQNLKEAQQKYLQASKTYWTQVTEQQTAVQQAQMERDPAGSRGLEETEDAKNAKTATGQASYYAMSTGVEMRQLEHKQELLAMETALDEKYTARNLSDTEREVLERERESAKLLNQQKYIDTQLAFNETQQMMEDQAAEAAVDPEQRDKHLENLNNLMSAEQVLQQEKEKNALAQQIAATSYNAYQKKRIEGIYKEKGAVEASKAMWKTYGDTIGKYATSMADQVKGMFAEMGKESKAAWLMYKAIAISQAIIDTYKTAQAGASALAGIPFVGPALAGMWIATSVMTGLQRVNTIRSQKPEGKAHGGVFQGGFEAYQAGGVTSGVAMGIVGDNPSGKELVIPSENIKKDSAAGYVREQDGMSEGPTIINMVTQQDIARAIQEAPEGKNVVINHIGRDMNERGSIYTNVKDTQAGNK
jgi:hypothetical protein